MRIVCTTTACSFVHWDNPVPVVGALVRVGGSYVIARNARWPIGLFSMLTGFVERGEDPQQTLIREVKEELGLDVETTRFLGHYAFHQGNQIIIAFEVGCRGQIVLGDEIADVMWLSEEEVRRFDFGPLELTTQIVKDALKPR